MSDKYNKKLDREVPTEEDNVRVINTETGEIEAEGKPDRVDYYDPNESDGQEGVYMHIEKEPDNTLMVKVGYDHNEEEHYSWAKITNYGGPEVDVEGSFKYKIL